MSNEDKSHDFDIDKASAELRAVAPPRRGGRKLTLASQCAAFAALRAGANFNSVAIVFDLSETTVSNLAGCIHDDRAPIEDLDGGLHDINLTRGRAPDRTPRYRAVAQEFNRLGELEFKRRYYTPDIHERILAAQSKPKIPRNRLLGNFYAAEFKGVNEMPIGGVWVTIGWMNEFWGWADCSAKGGQQGPWHTPYRTSKDALEGAKKYWARD